METRDDPFGGLDLERRVRVEMERLGLAGTGRAPSAIADHARRVARSRLALTAIRDPERFIERHIVESLAGAAMLSAGVRGTLVDLGSGNGYPGLVVAAVHDGLVPVLVESSQRKATFLRELTDRLPGAAVLEKHVERAADLEGLAPRLIVSRAMGGWERVLPRLVRVLSEDGEILLWAGSTVERVARRSAWSRLRVVERHDLAGRDRSWIWRFARAQ